MLLQLGLDETQRQSRAVNGDVQLLQRVWQPADVVLVAMTEKDPQHLAALFEEVRDVGQNEVDPKHVLLREHQPGVYDEHLVLPLQRPHVDADFAKAAERQVPKPRFANRGPRELTPRALSSWGFHNRRSCSASCLGTGGGSGGGGGVSSLSRYALTRSKSCSRSATKAPL